MILLFLFREIVNKVFRFKKRKAGKPINQNGKNQRTKEPKNQRAKEPKSQRTERSCMSRDILKLRNQICFPLYAASKEVIKLYKPLLDELDLTYTQYISLLVLWEQDNILVKDLGEKLYLGSNTLTPLLKKLEKQELIIRLRDRDDERKVYISLTDKGRQLEDKALQIPGKLLEKVKVDKADLIELKIILDRLLAHLH